MGQTLIEKILSRHADVLVTPGEIVDVAIDVRAARDFGGANVVQNLQIANLTVDDPSRTLFTFDCNPGGSDQGYAANQHFCRTYAREHEIGVRDIEQGIGTHIAIEEGLVGPGTTFVSTDSHANIMGAVGAFGQGMGDQDIAAAWAHGRIWFKVPPTLLIELIGKPGPQATAKDIVLAMARTLGAKGLLGCAAEITGDCVQDLDLASRITIASMTTEMGGIIALFSPSEDILNFCRQAGGQSFTAVVADPDAVYLRKAEIDIEGLTPLIARPGHPDDVVPVQEVAGRPIDSVFIGSCTNGRLEDLQATAAVLQGRRVAPGVVLKIVPATRQVWENALQEGLIAQFTAAGALIGNPGCAGCAAGQIGQNGPGEVTVSTGNRNFTGKQGKGEVYLASPATAAACAAAGSITTAEDLLSSELVTVRSGAAVAREPVPRTTSRMETPSHPAPASRDPGQVTSTKPTTLTGRIWHVDLDNIDTDMIYHNRHLAVTELEQMGQFTFGNLPGWEEFPQQVQAGDIVVTGQNFGCGSSRQQAVDCFKSLGIVAIVAGSYGAIYERNAINAGLPVLCADLAHSNLTNGDQISIELATGKISWSRGEVQGEPFSSVQMDIYQRGGLLA